MLSMMTTLPLKPDLRTQSEKSLHIGPVLSQCVVATR